MDLACLCKVAGQQQQTITTSSRFPPSCWHLQPSTNLWEGFPSYLISLPRSFVFSLCVSFNPRPLQPPTCVLSTKPAALPRPWGSPVEASLWCQGGAEAGKLENKRHLHLKGGSHPRGPPGMCWHMLRAAGRGMGNVMDCLGVEGKMHLQAKLCNVAASVEGSVKVAEGCSLL